MILLIDRVDADEFFINIFARRRCQCLLMHPEPFVFPVRSEKSTLEYVGIKLTVTPYVGSLFKVEIQHLF